MSVEGLGQRKGVASSIRIRGARTHNLQNVDLDLPRDALIVITGPSGSGKSSLAFDTIFAEGQRRYMESLSIGARTFLDQLPRPAVDLVDGLSPTIALDQTNRNRNPRSTVGTSCEVYDFLRLLFARLGERYRDDGQRVETYTPQAMIDRVMKLPVGTRFALIAPVLLAAGEESQREAIDDLRKQGFTRVAIGETLHDLGDDVVLDAAQEHELEVYVDRLIMKEGLEGRVGDSVETALRLSSGRLRISCIDGESFDLVEERALASKEGDATELTPSLFSFNSPEGACPACTGLGSKQVFARDRLIPNPELSLAQGAIRPLHARGLVASQRHLKAVASHFKIDWEQPWRNLSAEHQSIILNGSQGEVVPGLGKKAQPYEGVVAALEFYLRELDAETGGDEESDALEQIQGFLGEEVCSACSGYRLRPQALRIKVGGHTIADLVNLPIDRLLGTLQGLSLPEHTHEVATFVLAQAKERLAALIELGLGYLTLARATTTLSGGEAQRIRLATQIGSALVGVTYILDEPSVGLHQRDNEKLIAMLCALRDRGNTVIVVEHDFETMAAADFIVDMGPGAGVRGGRVVAAGPLAEVMSHPRSRTAAYLSGRAQIEVPKKRRRGQKSVAIRGARGHNLKDVTLRIPLGTLTCFTGVSGSGKSSIIVDTLLPEARRQVQGSVAYGLDCAGIDGLENFTRVISVDQSPIGRSARSNPATFAGLFADVRALFANLSQSKVRGYGAARFSFNVKGGRCDTCEGEGVRRVEMNFLPDMWVTCHVCGGQRYNRETLQIKYRGKSIAEVLDMPISQACEFFGNHRKLQKKLETLRDVGLGYMALGQSALTLSGGEAQRLKLARELGREGAGPTLFVLDEPTTGLHTQDVEHLLRVFDRLADEGHTIVVIEHNLEVIKCADFVVDMGPEGGDAGGNVVVAGTPEYVAQCAASHTGRYLAKALAGRSFS
jgi:excinuclease ABC subunit A